MIGPVCVMLCPYTTLFRSFQGALSWKWDGRFETVLAEFGVGNKDSVRAILERHLGTIWDSSSIASAPEDRKSTSLNSSHLVTSYAVYCMKKKKKCVLTIII